MELREKRTLNSKHFTRDDGKIDGQFHVGHVHYNSKLDATGLRSIDWTLSFDEIKRGWFFNYHSFRPFLPEYADEWVEFRDLYDDKDQTIKYKAHASHVKGRLVQPSEIGMERETGVNCVIYDDAFGEGKDYILYFTRSTLKKVVRVREGYKGTVEQRFTWDVDFPKENEKIKKVIRTENKEKISVSPTYELDTTRDKVFDTNKYTLIGNDKKDGKEWFTYLKPFRCWDSGTTLETYHTQIINVEYSANNKTLTKIVPASFILESTGDIFTDTTTSYYAGAGDGVVRKNNGTWSNMYSTGGGDYSDGSSASVIVVAQMTGSWYSGVGILPIDTSAITDTDTVIAATLNVMASGSLSGANTVSVIQSTATAATADWNKWTLTSEASPRVKFSSITADSYFSFPFATDRLSWINKTGTTNLALPSGNLIDNNPQNYGTFITMYCSESSGTSKDPYLSVTYGTAIGIGTVKAVVIAGGGGGGGSVGGAGGAGGYQYNAALNVENQEYTITIGGGGSAGTVNTQGGDGTDSSFGVLITATKGGGGGAEDVPAGRNGGCGGGGGSNSGGGLGGSGTQGGNGGTGYWSGGFNKGGAGGGGSAANGSNGGNLVGGNGGVGTANPITGSTVGQDVSGTYYVCGGGGGGSFGAAGTGGDGGNGGGGHGGGNEQAGTNGTANTGGGGGGGGQKNSDPYTQYNGGTGGSGVVVISYVTADLYATITGATNTKTTNGSETILTFLETGTVTFSAATPTTTSRRRFVRH